MSGLRFKVRQIVETDAEMLHCFFNADIEMVGLETNRQNFLLISIQKLFFRPGYDLDP